MLADYLPSTPAGLVELGAFLAMSEAERARRQPGEWSRQDDLGPGERSRQSGPV